MIDKAENIINRLKKALDIKTDTELSEILKINPPQLSNWKSRNTVSFEKIYEVCLKNNIDINSILLEEQNYKVSEQEIEYGRKNLDDNNAEIIKLRNQVIEQQKMIENYRAMVEEQKEIIKKIDAGLETEHNDTSHYLNEIAKLEITIKALQEMLLKLSST